MTRRGPKPFVVNADTHLLDRVDGVFSLTELASVHGHLPDVLGRLCRRIARALPAEVVSVYLREDDVLGDVLIMRANHGFRRVAVGNVMLRLGEGITGMAAEAGKPLYVRGDDSRSVSFDALKEERFPVLLAMPVIRRGRTIAVVVLQRAPEDAFVATDIALAASMTAPVALALEHADHRREDAAFDRQREPHEVRLAATTAGTEVVLGRAEMLTSFGSLAEVESPEDLKTSVERVVERLDSLLSELDLASEREHERVVLSTVLHDERFRRTLLEEAEVRGVSAALSVVARRYALAPALDESGVTDLWLEERAAEVGSLCRLIAAEVGQHAICRPGGVLCVAEAPGALLALELVRCRAAGVVMADPMRPEGLATAILQSGGVPVLSDVAGLFDRVWEGDPLVLDGTQRALIVHPSPTRSARARAGR